MAQPETPTGLRALVHQTDASGNQQKIQHDPPVDEARRTKSLFEALCCCFSRPPDETQQPRSRVRQQNYATQSRGKLIGPISGADRGRKCLVLDLDETLVHSSFKPTANPDYIIPVEIEGTVHHVYVCKRPGVEQFLEVLGRSYEIVIYTASLDKYADPLLDQLDVHGVIRWRLFREGCVHYEGNYVKDLSLLSRDLSQCIIIDNSPMSYMFHPENAIGCSSFIDNMRDRELYDIEKFLLEIVDVEDVRQHLHLWRRRQNAT